MISAFLIAVFQGNVLAQGNAAKLAPIQLTPERRQLIGLQIATVEEKELLSRIETTGMVEPDEQLDGNESNGAAETVFRQRFINHQPCSRHRTRACALLTTHVSQEPA